MHKLTVLLSDNQLAEFNVFADMLSYSFPTIGVERDIQRMARDIEPVALRVLLLAMRTIEEVAEEGSDPLPQQ